MSSVAVPCHPAHDPRLQEARHRPVGPGQGHLSLPVPSCAPCESTIISKEKGEAASEDGAQDVPVGLRKAAKGYLPP